MSRSYSALRALARFWLWFFFRRIESRHLERLPPTGPVLLCINHPNNLIDSLLVGAVVPRQVHFLATTALFRNPLLARLLHAAGAIPVYRREDDPERMARNVEMFQACVDALRDGRLVAIYPEGTTHAEARVQRIKTGAARIALGFECARQPGEGPTDAPGPLQVIPVGLSFEARKSFRGRVLIAFGEPVPVLPHVPQYRTDAVRAVGALTGAIQEAMEREVVHVDRIDAAEVARAVEQLYRSDLVEALQAERGLAVAEIDIFRLSRTIAAAVRHFQTREPERLERLWQRIQAYRALLAEYRVRDQAVRGRLEGPPRGRPIRSSALAIAGLPLFAYGLLVSGLPYLLPRGLSRRLARKETDYATVRLLSSIVAFPVFWGVELALVWWWAGVLWAVVFGLSLPVSSLAAYHYLHGLGRLRSQLRFGALALTRHHVASRLLAERRTIIDELERARRDYLAATRGAA